MRAIGARGWSKEIFMVTRSSLLALALAATLPAAEASGAPAVHGTPVFGVRPGAPLLFTIPVTGTRPLTFKIDGLPPGVIADAKSGRLSGMTTQRGTHHLRIWVGNAVGSTTSTLELEVGDDLALTPPMGWNSWYCMSESVDQSGVIAMAEAFAAQGLVEHGWTYINIDDCWQGERGGKYGALQGNERFPDVKAMCDRIHALGMKVGIYSTPWMGSYAGFPGGSCWNAQGTYLDRALPLADRPQAPQLFGHYPKSKELGLAEIGAHWFADADARQWAEWGIDYVKYDWHPIDAPTTARLAQGLRSCGRDIVLSLSNNLTFEASSGIPELAQLWRTTSDIHDSWTSIKEIGFAQDRWHTLARRGHWNDPDMLQVGVIGNPNQKNAVGRPTRLTPDEQRTQLGLWALLAAPLLLSCDVRQLDDFTRGLLTNDEVIAIDQDAAGIAGHQLAQREGGGQVWVRPLHGTDGRNELAVGLFNLGDQPQEVSATWGELQLSALQRVRDVFRRQDLPIADAQVRAVVPAHGVVLLRLVPVR